MRACACACACVHVLCTYVRVRVFCIPQCPIAHRRTPRRYYPLFARVLVYAQAQALRAAALAEVCQSAKFRAIHLTKVSESSPLRQRPNMDKESACKYLVFNCFLMENAKSGK